MKRVRANTLYRFYPVSWDVFDSRTDLAVGELVKVVNLPGCPRANTMNHCHVMRMNELRQWTFGGLVLTASLTPCLSKRGNHADSN